MPINNNNNENNVDINCGNWLLGTLGILVLDSAVVPTSLAYSHATVAPAVLIPSVLGGLLAQLMCVTYYSAYGCRLPDCAQENQIESVNITARLNSNVQDDQASVSSKRNNTQNVPPAAFFNRFDNTFLTELKKNAIKAWMQDVDNSEIENIQEGSSQESTQSLLQPTTDGGYYVSMDYLAGVSSLTPKRMS